MLSLWDNEVSVYLPEGGLGVQSSGARPRPTLGRLKVTFMSLSLGGGRTRQENVEVSPTQSRISPCVQYILRWKGPGE